jgi:rRNA-processing protein FCF1
MPSRPVVLDTNILLVPFQFKIDILRELDFLVDVNHHFVVSSRTVKELEAIGKAIGKNGMAGRLALKMLNANTDRIKIIESDMEVDDWIVEFAKANRAIVCTNDSNLRRRLKSAKVKVAAMKSKSRVAFV